MSKRFRPNLKKPPKKNLQCPNCDHPHDHKMNWSPTYCVDGTVDEYASIFICHHCLEPYARPYEPPVYVFDHVSGAITVVTP